MAWDWLKSKRGDGGGWVSFTYPESGKPDPDLEIPALPVTAAQSVDWLRRILGEEPSYSSARAAGEAPQRLKWVPGTLAPPGWVVFWPNLGPHGTVGLVINSGKALRLGVDGMSEIVTFDESPPEYYDRQIAPNGPERPTRRFQ